LSGTPAPENRVTEMRPPIAVAAATVGIVTATLLTSTLAGRPTGEALFVHAVLLGVLLLASREGRRIRKEETRVVLTALLAVGSMFFLYSSLGQVAFTAIPWLGDPWVRGWDRALFFGTEPVVWVAQVVAAHPWLTEPLAFFYAAFVPYVYMTVLLGLVGRPARTRAIFVLGFALLYGASFMGYLFVPARGPVVSMTDVLTVPLDGGFFYSIVVRSVDAVGGPHGAFPSLHVGATCLAMLVDFRHGDALRGLIYVPLLILICVATVVLRYHYVTDLVAGATLALAALTLAERWVAQAEPRPAPRESW